MTAFSKVTRSILTLILTLVLNVARAGADEDWTRAILQHDLALIERLLSEGANVNRAAEDGRTALMLAAGAGQTKLVQALIAAGADVNAVNQRGGTALMYAATDGDASTLSALLSRGAAVNAKAANGWTAVTLASARGHAGIVGQLLAAGADANATDIDGWTPLMRAVYEDRFEVVRVLLGDKSLRVNARDDRGETALHYAAATGSLKIAKMLLAHGADARATDASGRTPATVAAAEGHAALADFLRRSIR
jgi:ankyrin repeat protein